MFQSLRQRLRSALPFLRSYLSQQVLDRSRPGVHPPVRVVMRNGRKRLDGPTVNYSFGTLHEIFAEALRHVDLRAAAPRSVLLLGLGAGSVVTLLRREHRIQAPIVAVEVDAEVVRLGAEHFGLSRWLNLEVVVGDALEFVTTDRRQFDLVLVDVFVDASVPAPFRQRSFLAALRERLSPGGLLLHNLIADAAHQEDLTDFERQIATVFPDARSMAIRSNVVFVAHKPAAESAG